MYTCVYIYVSLSLFVCMVLLAVCVRVRLHKSYITCIIYAYLRISYMKCHIYKKNIYMSYMLDDFRTCCIT